MEWSEWWFLDLSLVIVFTGTVVTALIVGVSGAARILLVMPLLLFLPGYAFVSILYPDDRVESGQPFDAEKTGSNNPVSSIRGIGLVERFMLSVILSVAFVPVVGLLTTFTPWGISLRPILFGISLCVIVFSFVAIFARWRCPPSRRFHPSWPTKWMPFRRETSPFGRSTTVFNVAFVLSVLLLAISAGLAVTAPSQADGFTEFYIETEEISGSTESVYTSEYASGEPHDLVVYIGNNEHREMTYSTVVLLQTVSHENGDVNVEGQTELARQSATIPDTETHRQSIEITPTTTGDDLRLLVLLYVGDAPSDPHPDAAEHVLRLPITVT